MKHFIIMPTSIGLDINPGGHFLGAGLKWLIRQNDPDALFWDVPMYGYSSRKWQMVRDEADVLYMAGHPRVSDVEASHHWWDRGLWDCVSGAIDSGVRFVDAWAGASSGNMTMPIDKLAEVIRSRPWVKRILDVESRSSACIVRDQLAYESFAQQVPHVKLLPCNSWFARNWYGVDEREKSINLIVPVRLETSDATSIDTLGRVMTEMNGLPTIAVVHNHHDLAWCRENGWTDTPLMCVYDPSSLLSLYAKSELVLSWRIHATIPAMSLGCRVAHVEIDQRRLTLIPFGIEPIGGIQSDSELTSDFRNASIGHNLKDCLSAINVK